MQTRSGRTRNKSGQESSGTPKNNEATSSNATTHSSRAASAASSSNSASGSSSNANSDTVFIPPKTPVRSKTRDSQYCTPNKMVSKSGNFFYLKFASKIKH